MGSPAAEVHRDASRSTPAGLGSHARAVALSAPAEVPTSMSTPMPASKSARSAPTSNAPRLPPPLRTTVITSRSPSFASLGWKLRLRAYEDTEVRDHVG